MDDSSNQLLSGWSQTVLGCLKIALLKSISQDPNVIPEPADIKHYMLSQYRENAQLGKLYFYINIINETSIKGTDEITVSQDPKMTLDNLYSNPLERHIFVEVHDESKPFSENIGILIYREDLVDDAHCYTMTFFNERSFQEGLLGRIEIVAQKDNSIPRISSLRNDGFVNFDSSNYETDALIVVALGILENLVKNSSIKYVSLQDIEQYVKEENELLRPPEDKVMLLFLMRAMQGRLSCTKAKASLEMIEPFSVDFCLTYPIQVINRAANEIAKGNSRSILVYWNGKKLMTSDDYAFYLAYRKLGHKEIDVVVLGSMPEGAARVVKKGGAELIPPVAYGPSFGLSSSFVDSKYEELDNRLSGKNIQVNVSELYGIFMVFCEIMQDKNTKERDLHNYILQNPILLDPHIRVISSEVWLGKEYRIDIIAQYNNGKPLLVELERHNLPLFAKSGQPQAPVTHAYQQVEDWLQWWSENQSLIPLEIDKTLPPEGLVVIGRSNKLSNKEKKKLIHLNQNRRVRLLTYDDLLDQLESIIYVLERRIRLTR